LPRRITPAYDHGVAALEAVALPSISTWELPGLELHLLEAVGARRASPVLMVYAIAGTVVSLGRYHLYDGASERGGVTAMRRLAGGRAVGAGDGWLGMALVLPEWGALLPEQDRRLKPDQVMNRYVRGLLAAMRVLGLECFYPGRDAITFQRREVAACTFEVDASGALLFEALIAVSRGMEELSRDLDRLDPDGTVPSAVHTTDTSTTMARELKRLPGFEEIAQAIIKGYGEVLGGVNARELAPEESAAGAERGRSLQSIHWLRRATGKSEYNRSKRLTAQLGQVEARLRVSADNRIERLMLCGDFLANSPAIAELEASLEGQSHDLVSISNAVTKTFSNGNNFILGLGDLSNLVRLIADAQ
jgi:lipoate-protein ligase A